MTLKSLMWLMAGVLLLCLFVPIVSAGLTIMASGSQSYFLGDDVEFYGTNTESTTVYLFLAGPNLPANGAQIASIDPQHNAVVDLHPETFKAVPVTAYQFCWTWEVTDFDAGTYTIYALTTPRDRSNLGGTTYGTVSIIIKKPFSPHTTRTRIEESSAILFIGEEGLDILNVVGGANTIHYWAPSADMYIDPPTKNVNVALTKANFFVDPTNFTGYSGNWYKVTSILPPLTIVKVFTVADPYLDLSIWDASTSADVTDTTVQIGTPLTFKCPTNMNTIFGGARQNTGLDGDANVDIIVKGPDGRHYYSLYNATGWAHPLIGQSVISGLWTWGHLPNAWATDASVNGANRYPMGTYTVTAESTLNNMKENYQNGGADYTGKTVSAAHTITLSPFPHRVRDAVDAVVADSSIVGPDISKVSVSASPDSVTAGNTINQWNINKPSFSAPCDGYFVFVDMAPGANWEHSVKYVFVCRDGTRTPYDASSPPSIPVTYAAGTDTGVGDVVWTPQDPYMWTPSCTNDCTNNYALLISGGKDADSNFVRYWNDIAFMYTNLLDYSYPKSKITVLMSDKPDMTVQDRCIAASGTTCTGKDISPLDIDGCGFPETIGSATKTNILATLDAMAPTAPAGPQKLPQGANLFIFTTSHGGWDQVANSDPNTNSVYMYGWGGSGADAYVTDLEFVNKLNLLTQVSSITLVMENCYSGGFTNEFLNPATVPAGQKRVIITAANGNEYSNGNGFSNAVTTALAGRNRGLAGVFITDKNADKLDPKERVSMSEAIEYTKLNDPYVTTASGLVNGKEHPTLTALAGTDATTQFLTACTAAAPQSITVDNPANAVSWQRETRPRITWTAKGLADKNVKITLLMGGVPQTPLIADSVPAIKGYFDWTIPPAQALQTNYAVKVEAINVATAVSGTSPGTFKITAKPTTNYGTLIIKTTDFDTGAVLTGAAIVLDLVPQGTTQKTIPNIAPLGNSHTISLTRDEYYPMKSTQVTVNAGSFTKTYRLNKIPTDVINAKPLDRVPYGGMDITSNPDGAEVWIGKAGSIPTDTGLETEGIINLMPGLYDVYVTKDNYQQSETRQVRVEQYTSTREPEKVYLTLPPKVLPYTVEGFYQPVDNLPVVNKAKAGQAVPTKWHLSTVNGPVSDPASFAGLYSFEVTCGELSPLSSEVEQYASGNSGLQYLGSGNWQFNWKTPKAYAGKCQEMFVRFNDGQELHAEFKFK